MRLLIVSTITLTLILAVGCTPSREVSEGESQESEPIAEKSQVELQIEINADEGTTGSSEANDIQARNEAILARLQEEELAREAAAAAETEAAEDKEGDNVGAGAETESFAEQTNTDSEAPARSSMEIMRERAAQYEPRIAEIARKADLLDDNFRRYMDACYQKYTTGATAGTYSGQGYGQTYGAAAGRDWFAVYEQESTFTYSGTYTETTAVSNETTAYCRELWSDVLDGLREVNFDMRAMVTSARRDGVLPGHLRDLRRKYRLDWEGWTR